MELKTQLHTIFMLVGPTECGKSSFAKEILIPQLQFSEPNKNFHANVQYLPSDVIRQEMLGNDYDKYAQIMLEASDQTFELLFKKLDLVTKFPINAEFVILDTTGLTADFREKVRETAKENNYNVEVILFDYRNRNDYYTSERSKKLISNHVTRLKKEILPNLAREQYHHIHRIRAKDFTNYEIEVTNRALFLETLLPTNEAYTMIGDVHECVSELKALLLKLGCQIEDNKISYSPHKMILVGDWIDKGKNTREITEFLYENQQHFLFVLGNHENFVHKYILGEIKGANQEIVDNYFDSIPDLVADPKLFRKFEQLFHLAQPFYHYIGHETASFYVTHSPCQNKYIGKLDGNSMRHQRNFHLDRTRPVQEQLTFLENEAVNNYPYHIFGHVAAKQAFRVKNKLHLDTGCAHGNELTAVTLKYRKPIFKSIQSANQQLNGELPTLFKRKQKVQISDLDTESSRRLHHIAENKINFISGTMSPAPKDLVTNNLESLEKGLEYFAKKGLSHVVLQPKYMGSRCNIYLHKNTRLSFAVSRNGYKITHIDLSPIYQSLKQRFSEYMAQNKIQMLILDGELLPWQALGKELIEKQFQPIQTALETELNFLQAHNFDENLAQLITEYNATDFENDQTRLSKKQLTEKYSSRIYQNYKPLHQIKQTHKNVAQHKEALDIYKQQLGIYAVESALDYKAFSLLKIIYQDGTEQIPAWTASDMYSFLNDDAFVLLDLTQSDYLNIAEQYFATMTTTNKMEGIVIKPEQLSPDIAPYMKVRNMDYLSIIYGYDFQFPHKFNKLIKQKSINKKLKTSINEWFLGSKLLTTRWTDISPTNNQFNETAANLLFEVEKERDIDPRL
ncbi:metallophosphoesterase [Paenilisteria rocourtiae]|uniref:Polynucleotide 3'-phosphatase /polynucleotide 5'-hydroxyl-kinase /polynucleotide 2',3'-cyclic phosphate phosphodiesterase n=1 Tax=Listeria rocourtiae TaxID=647910 RepID=A0A4R6ZHG2_9LIST|nr:metallophosphoesterase [Listeria rocourtiae]TDR51585.1 polynucleotide 3'-phosphatase /polynucleotide 5'-hydroxyl-kinase /polynucleotide 2',3'-cyclic phosphate phosphodiesterase [Listeria rocourtiae]